MSIGSSGIAINVPSLPSNPTVTLGRVEGGGGSGGGGGGTGILSEGGRQPTRDTPSRLCAVLKSNNLTKICR